MARNILAWPVVLAADRWSTVKPPPESMAKTLNTWRRKGPAYEGRFKAAERILDHFQLNWWDVWNEETVQTPEGDPDTEHLKRIKFAFTGCRHEGLDICDLCFFEGEIEQMELAA